MKKGVSVDQVTHPEPVLRLNGIPVLPLPEQVACGRGRGWGVVWGPVGRAVGEGAPAKLQAAKIAGHDPHGSPAKLRVTV